MSWTITPNLNSSGNKGVTMFSPSSSKNIPVPHANRIRSAKAASGLKGVILKHWNNPNTHPPILLGKTGTKVHVYIYSYVYVYRYIYTYVYICIHVYIPTSICENTETYVVASDSSHDLHNIALILLSKAESNFDTGSSPTSHPHAWRQETIDSLRQRSSGCSSTSLWMVSVTATLGDQTWQMTNHNWQMTFPGSFQMAAKRYWKQKINIMIVGSHWQWQTRNRNQRQLTLTSWDKLGHVTMMHWPEPRAGQWRKKIAVISFNWFILHSALLVELHQNRIVEHAWLCQPDLRGGLVRKSLSALLKQIPWMAICFLLALYCIFAQTELTLVSSVKRFS